LFSFAAGRFHAGVLSKAQQTRIKEPEWNYAFRRFWKGAGGTSPLKVKFVGFVQPMFSKIFYLWGGFA